MLKLLVCTLGYFKILSCVLILCFLLPCALQRNTSHQSHNIKKRVKGKVHNHLPQIYQGQAQELAVLHTTTMQLDLYSLED